MSSADVNDDYDSEFGSLSSSGHSSYSSRYPSSSRFYSKTPATSSSSSSFRFMYKKRVAMKIVPRGGSFHSCIGSYPTTPMPSLAPQFGPPTLRPAVVSTSRPSLSDLHLDGFTWLEPLLDASADNIVLPTNDTSVTLKLSKDSVAPKEESGDAECASAVEGGAGVCVYLSRCDAARDITVDVYRTTYCTLSQGYAGVCCPQKKVDISH